jgi:flagellin-like protein
MVYKKSQSNIITTVLLVLVALAAVAIVAVFITNSVRNSAIEAEIMSKVSGMEISGVEYVLDGNVKQLRVLIKKGVESPEELSKISIVVSLKNGTSIVDSSSINVSDFNLLETKAVIINVNNEEIRKVEIIPQYMFKDKTINGKQISAWTGEIKINPKCEQRTITSEPQYCSGFNESQCESHTGCHPVISENPGDCSFFNYDETGCIANNPQCTPNYSPILSSCGGQSDEVSCSNQGSGCYWENFDCKGEYISGQNYFGCSGTYLVSTDYVECTETYTETTTEWVCTN